MHENPMKRALLPCLLLIAACTGTDGSVLLDRDAGQATTDTGITGEDSGMLPDTGVPDSGSPDTGSPDTGIVIDGGEPDGGDLDAGLPEVDCSQNPPVFPSFDRSCNVSADCAIGTVQADCCGTLTVTGINASEQQRFDEAASLCAGQFPQCGCPAQPTRADDGTVATSTAGPIVDCLAGTCSTTFQGPRTPCGPDGATCDTATEVCVARLPSGPSIAYVCEPVPAGCEADRTCGCMAPEFCTGAFNICNEDGPNQIICECPACQ